MRPRDPARIGQLVLSRGAWNGTQIVPASWIDAATAPQINGGGLYFYGYKFWLGRSLVHKREIDWASATGNGGQRVFIVPALDLVVVVTAGLLSQLHAGLGADRGHEPLCPGGDRAAFVMARIMAAAPGALLAVVRASSYRVAARCSQEDAPPNGALRAREIRFGAEWCALVTDAFNPTTARASPARPASLPDHCAAFVSHRLPDHRYPVGFRPRASALRSSEHWLMQVRRYRVEKPFWHRSCLISPVAIDRRQRIVSHLLEGGIVAPQQDGVRLDRKRLVRHDVVGGRRRVGQRCRTAGYRP